MVFDIPKPYRLHWSWHKTDTADSTLLVKRRSAASASKHGLAEPGKPITYRRRRADSATGPFDGADEDDDSMAGHRQRALEPDLERNPGRFDRRPRGGLLVNIPSLVVTVAGFLIVFGALYTILEYLLLRSRASAQCTPETMYVPLITTVTVGCSSSAAPASSPPASDGSVLVHATIYSTSTMTNTVTVMPDPISMTAVSSAGGSSYYYGINSGTTSWLNGISPSSGASLTTATSATTIYISPAATMPTSTSKWTTTTTIHIQSTATQTETMTVPLYTSTTFSMMSPGSTITSTSTHYNTITVSYAPSSSIGPGPGGWNSTSSQSSSAAPDSASGDQFSAASVTSTSADSAITQTSIIYYGTGTRVTSITTNYLTTTVPVASASMFTGYTSTLNLTGAPQSSSLPTAPAGTAGATPSNSHATAPPSAAPEPTVNLTSADSSSRSAATTLSSSGLGLSPDAASVPVTGETGTAPMSVAGTIASTSMATINSTTAGPVISNMGSVPASSTVLNVTSGTMVGSIPTGVSMGTTASGLSSATPVSSASSSLPISAAGISSPASTSTSLLTSTLPVSGTGIFSAALNTSVAGAATSASGTSLSVSNSFGTLISASSAAASDTSAPNAASSASLSIIVPVPLTTTMDAGSLEPTVILETTSTTLGLVGGQTPSTVSGYFVFNGTTVVPVVTGTPTSTASSAVDSSSISIVASTPVSAAASSNFNSSMSMTATATDPGFYGAGLSSSASTTTTSSVESGAYGPSNYSSPSVPPVQPTSAPINTSSAALSATSSTTSGFGISSLASSVKPQTISNGSTSSSSLATSSGPSSVTVSSRSLPSSVYSRSTMTTSTTSSASAASTSCGQSGKFTLTFDDLPSFTPTHANSTDITQNPPVPNPYHHFTFSDGYVYAPSKREPFAPRSSPNVGVFLANGTGLSTSTMAKGELADGPYEAMSAFWFDVYSGWFGCDDSGPDPCTLVLSGYTYSAASQSELLTYTQNATVPACPGFKSCQLVQVAFPDSFRGLSGLQIQAYVNDAQKMFFVDDVAMDWTNNTCAAGLQRLKYH